MLRQIKCRQAATPTVKIQLEIGKEYDEKPLGLKAKYAATSPWGDRVLRKWAHKYRVIKATGKWKGVVIGAAELKKVRLFKVSPGRWPWAEDRLFEDFVELRKVGIAVDGPYLKAKMMKYVPKTPGVDPDKVKKFKASNVWLQGFMERKNVTVRVQTNKKSRSQFKRSRLVRNFHYYVMYKAALEPSTRKTE